MPFEQKFEHSKEERSGASIEHWAEEQTLDYIMRETRVSRLKMDEFIDVYGKDRVDRDKAAVAALKAKFDAELEELPESEQKSLRLSRKRGEVLEIIITEQGELSDWFGPNAMTMRAAEIDDYKRGVDLVVEFAPEDKDAQIRGGNVERIALGIDASDNPLAIARKVEANMAKIMGKRPPAQVSYFRSQVTDYKGRLDKVIPVVIGLEGKNMADLVGLQNKVLRGIDSKETNRQLADHPVQRVLLEEISAQLKWYMKLLELGRAEHPAYEKKDIESFLAIIKELLDDKKSISLGKLDQDMVMQMIKKIVG